MLTSKELKYEKILGLDKILINMQKCLGVMSTAFLTKFGINIYKVEKF